MTGLRQSPPTQLTREEFKTFLRKGAVAVYVWPYEIVPCSCGDYNCHGWRLVVKPRADISPIGLS